MSFWRSPCCSLFLLNDVIDYTLTSFAAKSHQLAVELSSASWRVRTLSSAWKEMDLICVARFEINWVYDEILRRFTLRVFWEGYGEWEKQIPMIRTWKS